MAFRITPLIRVSAFGIAAVMTQTYAADSVLSRQAPVIRYMPEQISAPDFNEAPTPAVPTEMRWRQELVPGRHAPFLAQAGRLFTVGTSSDYRDTEGLYAWEVATGKSVWSRPELRVVDTPWINERGEIGFERHTRRPSSNNSILHSEWGYSVIWVDPATGSTLRELALELRSPEEVQAAAPEREPYGEDRKSAIMEVGGRLYVQERRHLTALDAATGKWLWRAAAGEIPNAKVVLGGFVHDVVYARERVHFIGRAWDEAPMRIVTVDARDGHELWSREITSSTNLLVNGDQLFYLEETARADRKSDPDYGIVALDAGTGKILARTNIAPVALAAGDSTKLSYQAPTLQWIGPEGMLVRVSGPRNGEIRLVDPIASSTIWTRTGFFIPYQRVGGALVGRSEDLERSFVEARAPATGATLWRLPIGEVEGLLPQQISPWLITADGALATYTEQGLTVWSPRKSD